MQKKRKKVKKCEKIALYPCLCAWRGDQAKKKCGKEKIDLKYPWKKHHPENTINTDTVDMFHLRRCHIRSGYFKPPPLCVCIMD